MDDLLTAPADPLAEVWCSKCDQPSVHGHRGVPYYDAETQSGRCLSCGGDPYHPFIAYCERHDPRMRQAKPWEQPAARLAQKVGSAEAGRIMIPDAITDPWLRRQYAQATGAIDPRLVERDPADFRGDDEGDD